MDKRGINSRLRTVAGNFSIGELCVCAGGLDILKIDKNSTYSISRFNLGGLEFCLGAKSTKTTPVATGLSILWTKVE